MIFHSFDFILFFIVVLASYWMLSHRHQRILLLVVSYVFYGYIHPWFLYPLLFSTALDFLAALAIETFPVHRKRFLITSLIGNLGLLAIFKYFGFFVENVSRLLAGWGWSPDWPLLEIVLPVGISFYTFQSISYTVDVFHGRVRACRNPLDFALYVVFFPQLVAGPIERAQDMLRQFQLPRSLTAEDLREGVAWMVWGYFKKLVIADNVALIANNVFLLENPPFSVLWVGVLAFSFQILADFSGYTDIARGVARLLGFRLSRNFHHPYLALSPGDFWRRWHISLSEWIRDYVYIPLGGSRVRPVRHVVNVLVTFFLCGLWHGASWNFVLWGVYHGVLILFYRAAAGCRWCVTVGAWPGMVVLRWGLMFALTNIGWLFFRETDLHHLFNLLTIAPGQDTVREWQYAWFLLVKVAIHSVPVWLHAAYDHFLAPRLASRPGVRIMGQWVMISGLFLGILNLRSYVRIDFIYFQF